MTKRTNNSPDSLWQFGNPFLSMMLGHNASGFVFQPSKAMALGQIQVLGLINRRMQACLALPQELAACRTPNDLVLANLRFYQMALRDYSDAVAGMAEAWDNAVHAQTPPDEGAKPRHDYLSLSTRERSPSRSKTSKKGGEGTHDCAA